MGILGMQYLCEVCKNRKCPEIGTKKRHSYCKDFIK